MSGFFSGGFGGLLGGGLGLLGGILGGQGARDAASSQAQAARELMQQQYGWGQQSMGWLAPELFGGQGGLDFLRGRGVGGLFSTPDQTVTERVTEPFWGASRPGGGGMQRGRGPAPGTRTYDQTRTIPGQRGIFGTEAEYNAQYGGRPGLFSEMNSVNDAFAHGGAGMLDRYNQDTRALGTQAGGYLNSLLGMYGQGRDQVMGSARGVEGLAREWGVGSDRLIDEDMQRALTAANQRAAAQLGASGLGNSTLVANQMSGNANEAARTAARLKLGVSQQQLDRQMGARQYATDTLASQLGRAQDLANMWNQAQQQQSFQRANTRTALESDLQNRDMTNRQRQLDTRLQVLMSPLMNPGTSINTASFIPQQTGQGMMGSALGSALGGMGGMLFGNWLSQPGRGNVPPGQEGVAWRRYGAWE